MPTKPRARPSGWREQIGYAWLTPSLSNELECARALSTPQLPREVGDQPAPQALRLAHGSVRGASVACALAPLASAARFEPARSRAGGRRVAAPRELPRNRACPAEPGNGAATRRHARRAAARPERDVASSRTSRGIPGVQ